MAHKKSIDVPHPEAVNKFHEMSPYAQNLYRAVQSLSEAEQVQAIKLFASKGMPEFVRIAADMGLRPFQAANQEISQTQVSLDTFAISLDEYRAMARELFYATKQVPVAITMYGKNGRPCGTRIEIREIKDNYTRQRMFALISKLCGLEPAKKLSLSGTLTHKAADKETALETLKKREEQLNQALSADFQILEPEANGEKNE
ncbi:MAG: hypothetical protein PHF37_06500 [Phycisphaerae bacterium]|nr:hypothetical protein [Phycisphaerae bacterium]